MLSTPKIKLAIKAILTVLVLAFVARHVAWTWRDIQGRGETVRIDAAWVGLSVALYLAGLSAFGAYFWRVLQAGATPTAFFPAFRAYLISHLGKYVPGKAMVVVMRAGLVVPYGARPATAAFATLYETLVMMAAGGLVAGAGFAIGSGPSARVPVPFSGGSEVEAPLALLGFGLGLAFLVVVWPSVFPRLAGLAKVPLPNVGPDALPRFSFSLLVEGLAWSTLGWILLGLSQVAVIRGLLPEGLAVSSWPLAIASVALATVAGFVVPISPGGLGVREWVLWTALASAIDRDLAVVAALLLRLAWVIGEVLVAAALTAIRPPSDGAKLAMISVVVPLYNEAESLAALHAELARAIESNRLGPAEILFVDDGSRDGSWAVIQKLAASDPRVRGIRFRRNFGKAAALTAGFRAAKGATVFTLDGDLQDDPAEIPRFLAKLDEGFEVVSGWKRTRHDPWHKVGPSRVFNRMVSALTGCKLHDHNCGFKAYRREVLDEVTLYGELHRFVPVLAFERGFKVAEIVVNHRPRKFGHSKYGVARFIKGLLDLLTVHFLSRYGQRPLHVLGALGLAMLGAREAPG